MSDIRPPEDGDHDDHNDSHGDGGDLPPFDPVLRRALDHAPDHAALPDAGTRDAIRKIAIDAVAPSTIPAAVPAPWWRRWLGIGGNAPGSRMPWSAALATALLAVLVTALWHREPVPQAQLDGEAKVAIAPMTPAPAPASASPSAAADAHPAPSAEAVPAPPDQRASKAESAAPPAPALGGAQETLPRAALSAAPVAPSPFAALPRWTSLRLGRDPGDARYAREGIEGLAALVDAVARSATSPEPALAAPVEVRLALYRGNALTGVLEIAGSQVRWTPQPGGMPSTGTPPAQALRELKALLAREPAPTAAPRR